MRDLCRESWCIYTSLKIFKIDRSFTKINNSNSIKSIPFFEINKNNKWAFNNLKFLRVFSEFLFSHGHWIPSAARGFCLKGNFNYFHLCGFYFLYKTHQGWLVSHEFCRSWSVGCLKTIKYSKDCQNLKN